LFAYYLLINLPAIQLPPCIQVRQHSSGWSGSNSSEDRVAVRGNNWSADSWQA